MTEERKTQDCAWPRGSDLASGQVRPPGGRWVDRRVGMSKDAWLGRQAGRRCGAVSRLGFRRQTKQLSRPSTAVRSGSLGGRLPGSRGLLGCWHGGDMDGASVLEHRRQLRVSSPLETAQGPWSPPLDYVARGMWNSSVSKMRALRGGRGSLSALWSSLKSPVPMFMGIPMMMHSDTPHTESFWPK